MSTGRASQRMRRWRLARDLPLTLVLVLAATWAALFSWLSVARHEGWWTGRFDLGNMVQAIWNTAHGDFLMATNAAGEQASRLGSHVDPLLVVLVPLQWITDSAVPLLVAQAVIVAAGAVPAFLLGRRWLGDDRLAVAGALMWLLYAPIQWAVVTDLHAVTLAAPLLMLAIWAAEVRNDWVLAIAAALALMGKEQVGLAVAILGIWIIVRQRRWIAGAVLSAASLAWTLIAVLVIIPASGTDLPRPFGERFGRFGDTPSQALVGAVSQPLEVITTIGGWQRLSYLLALLLPLLFLPLFAPLLAAAALPDLMLNMLADWWPNHSIEFHYAAVPSPFLVAAAMLGLAGLRRRTRPEWLRRMLRPAGVVALVLVGAGVLGTVVTGPVPIAPSLSRATESRLQQYRPGPHAAVLDEAAALIPAGAVVSAGNGAGGHLSARRRILVFPEVGDAAWVIVDRTRPDVFDRLDPTGFAYWLDRLRARGDFRLVLDRDGVMVFRRVGGEGG
jgi:uncharacterized membrane protein